jgi:hypothetical protein
MNSYTAVRVAWRVAKRSRSVSSARKVLKKLSIISVQDGLFLYLNVDS